MREAVLCALAARPPATLTLVGDGRGWSAAEAREEIDRLAARLEPARVVAVLADNGPAWVIADLACLHAGKVHLPLPAFFSPAQMASVLAQTAADTILTDQPERIGALDLGFAITGHWQGLTCLRRVVAPVAMPAGTLKISFTSGSTGTPKGVCLSAAGLADTARALHERLADLPITRHLAVLPLPLLLENVAGIYAPLLRGAAVHLPPLASLGWRGMAGFDTAALQAAVATSGAASLILVPELLKAWSLFLGHGGQRAPASLSYVAVGGARVTPALLAQARALGLPAYQGYGLTECGSVVSLNRPGDDGDDVGRPLAHVHIEVAEGEVQVGAGAFLGYLGDEASAKPGPFPTGDLGAFTASGHLVLAGRRKNLLITSFGRNIAPEWVESVLLAQPAIAQAVVIGDARPALGAIIVPLPGATSADLAAAIAAANAGLPDYARIGHWLASQPFNLTNGLATGNGRPVRPAISQHFAAEIAAFYDHEEAPHAVL
jgi:long-subunit acyl-CoA synthetase (AMP-forming)